MPRGAWAATVAVASMCVVATDEDTPNSGIPEHTHTNTHTGDIRLTGKLGFERTVRAPYAFENPPK